MQHAQRAVAIFLAVGEHPERHDVGHLFKADVAFGHLVPDRKRVLFAARNLDLEPGFGEALFHLQRNRIDLPAILAAQLFQPGVDRGKAHRLQLAEGQRLHFAHVLIHADPLGQRRVDIHRLARDQLAFLRRLDEVQRAHVVQPVGQLDQQHADILGHGEQELAQVFGRAFILGHGLDLGKLGHPVDQPRDLGAEMRLDILDRRQRVLDRVVQQRGDDGRLIELQIGHKTGNFDRVAEIGIAAGAFLAAVFLDGIDIGAVEHRLIGLRVVFENLLDEFVLAQHVTLNMGAGVRGGKRVVAAVRHGRWLAARLAGDAACRRRGPVL